MPNGNDLAQPVQTDTVIWREEQGIRYIVPTHVAIIMDGNGRWAVSRGFPRVEGHRRGMQAFRRTVEAADKLGIRYLTVYSFSSENWKRPATEVSELMKLLKVFIKSDLDSLHKKNVCVKVIGERHSLTDDIKLLLKNAEEKTENNTGLTLVVAFNYGGRQELTNAVQLIADKVFSGKLLPQQIQSEIIESHLYTRGIPDPDLLIRTSGEQRLSNFLIWQCSYTEFVFVTEHWPEFSEQVLKRALIEYSQRERRYGAVSS